MEIVEHDVVKKLFLTFEPPYLELNQWKIAERRKWASQGVFPVQNTPGSLCRLCTLSGDICWDIPKTRCVQKVECKYRNPLKDDTGLHCGICDKGEHSKNTGGGVPPRKRLKHA